MKLSKSKLALAKVINENGGWVDGTMQLATSNKNGSVYLWSNTPIRIRHVWDFCGRFTALRGDWRKLPNWHQTILSREEYYQAYPKADACGWIEWKGGECPVGDDSLVDVRFPDGSEYFNTDADWDWSNTSDTPISHYRPSKKEVNSELCESVMRSIPEPESHEKLSPEAIEDAKFALMSESIEESKRKPTIEQLAADYRNRKDYADRKQQEADAAKADADEALRKMELAGEAIGFMVTPITAKQESELVSEVKVGDEVECVESNVYREKYRGMIGTVLEVDGSSTPYLVDFGGEKRIWCHEVKFIRRP